MKFIYSCSILLLFLIGCSKDDTGSTAFQQGTIAGSGSVISGSTSSTAKIGKWKITALVIGNTPQTLTAGQLNYIKQYTSTGQYADSDGIVGTWSIPSSDSLVEIYSNYPGGTLSQSYKISNLSATQMTLTYYVNSTNVTATYTATN